MNEYETLIIEYNIAMSLAEEDVCNRFNSDSKEEYLQALSEEIKRFECEDDEESDDEEVFLTQLCISQGISRFC